LEKAGKAIFENYLPFLQKTVIKSSFSIVREKRKKNIL
jgi:hypothetical protein